MKPEDRLKVWASYAEISRKWVSVLDAKAGFVAALNLGLLSLLWSGAKIQDGACWAKWSGVAATLVALGSIGCAIWVALPRESLSSIFGKGVRWQSNYRPISFYGFVAQAYGIGDFEQLKKYADSLSQADAADEALEQHFVIAHVIAKKSAYLRLAGLLFLVAAVCAGFSLLARSIQ